MKIYSMWLQGRAQAPALCQRIFDLWEHFNPDMQFHVIERDEAMDRLSGTGVVLDGLGLEKVANLVRIKILAEEGGIWADATAMPTMPLADWFHGRFDTAGFFARRDPQRDLIVSNWFLYSKPDHPLACAWRDFLFDYYAQPRLRLKGFRPWHCRSLRQLNEFNKAWRSRRDRLWFVDRQRGFDNPFVPYFVMIYGFEEMLRKDPDLAHAWARVPVSPAAPCLLMGREFRLLGKGRMKPLIEELLPIAPMHKLAHKHSDFSDVLDAVERRIVHQPDQRSSFLSKTTR